MDQQQLWIPKSYHEIGRKMETRQHTSDDHTFARHCCSSFQRFSTSIVRERKLPPSEEPEDTLQCSEGHVDDEDKSAKFKAFLKNQYKRKPTTIKSTYANFFVTKPSTARKPGQKKRVRVAKTIKKWLTLNDYWWLRYFQLVVTCHSLNWS